MSVRDTVAIGFGRHMLPLVHLIVSIALASGPGLPGDFPLAPGLQPCVPQVVGPEVICDWHHIDGHAVYTFYSTALVKAGYTIVPGAGEATSPREFGAIGFKKTGIQGAVTVVGTDLTIQVFYGQSQ
jgi:hypothetical protein